MLETIYDNQKLVRIIPDPVNPRINYSNVHTYIINVYSQQMRSLEDQKIMEGGGGLVNLLISSKQQVSVTLIR